MPSISTSRVLSLRWLMAVLVLLCVSFVHAEETTFKTLLMPGKLVQGHAKLEANCAQCHISFEKKAQDKLCLTCHKNIAADIATNKGFHSTITPASLSQDKTPPCKQCHTDHKGRDADIIGLDRDTFNHAHTDFKLEGKHSEVACDSCHKAGKKFREAPSACSSCHEKDDRHRGALGKQCESCHSSVSWSKTQFDHNKTDFVLKGAHQEVNCAACHPSQRFKNTPKACVGCHAINDVHRGQNGTDCKKCHSEKSWKTVSFDHNRDTHFSLRGSHATADCNSCHKQGKFEAKLGTACVDCHRADDVHKSKNGNECQQCHNEQKWKDSKFDHAKDTKFSLKGKHENLACESCHRGNVKTEKLAMTCISCHRNDDIHKGQQGDKCERCHNEAGWSKKIAFDHSLTKFPLVGLHATVPCESCHLSSSFKDAAKTCRECHQGDDKHKGGLGTHCASCHNPSGWNYWDFNHDKQTHFPLTGTHTNLSCASCHDKPTEKIQLASDCYSCHAKDDRHDGKFGRDCAQCHATENFDQVRILRR